MMTTLISNTCISIQTHQPSSSTHKIFSLHQAIITLSPQSHQTHTPYSPSYNAKIDLHPIHINLHTTAIFTPIQNVHQYLLTNKLSFAKKDSTNNKKSSSQKVSKINTISLSCPSLSLRINHDFLSHPNKNKSQTSLLYYNIQADSISIHCTPPSKINTPANTTTLKSQHDEPNDATTYNKGRLLITSSHVNASILFSPHASLPTFPQKDPVDLPNDNIHNHLLTIGVIVTNFEFDTHLPVQPKITHQTNTTLLPHEHVPAHHHTDNQTNATTTNSYNASTATLSVSVDKVTMYEQIEAPQNTLSYTTDQNIKIEQPPNNSTILLTSYLTKVIVTKNATTIHHHDQPSSIRISQDIHVQTDGPSVHATWSIICHWTFFSAIRKTNDMIRQFKNIIQNKEQSQTTTTTTNTTAKKKPITNVYLRFNDAIINAHIILGTSSTMDVQTKHFTLDIQDDHHGRWRKPTVHLKTGYTTVLFNQCECDVVTLDGMEFHQVIRHANQSEIDAYLAQALFQQPSPSPTKTTEKSLLDQLAQDDYGHPLKEIVELKVINMVTVRLPPSLHLGKVIDDFVVTPRTLFEGLRAAGLIKPKSQSKRPYHLMTIMADIPFIDAKLLEHKNASFSTNTKLTAESQCNDQFPQENVENKHYQNNEDDLYINRMRLRIDSLNLKIDRNTPPETTQSILNDLDEDKTKTHVYGPIIQGGKTTCTIGLAICTLHPATIVTPLALLRNCTVDSLFLLAPLSPETEGITKGRTIDVPLKFHHETNHQCDTAKNGDDRSSACTYGMALKTSGIPPKVFFGKGTSLTAQSIEGAYGMLLMGSIPKLMEIIKRLTPPPPPPPPSLSHLKPPPPLPWFDNLRFWIHGEMSLMAECLSFRWLLDNETRYDLSILLTCHHFSFEHSVGTIGLGMDDVIVSIPGTSYELFLERELSNESWGLLHEMCDFKNEDERHSLLLLPHLVLKLDFEWIPPYPDTKSSEHHCVYLVHHEHNLGMEPVPNKFPDKFERFRSNGVKMNLNTTLGAGADFTNWVALRIDALPWLTHQTSVPFIPPPRDEDAPEPLPRIESMAISVSLKDLQVGAWFYDPDQRYKEQQGGRKSAKASPADGLCLILPKVHFFMEKSDIKIHADGPIQAALMNICYENSNPSPTPAVVPRSDHDDMGNCDRMTGWLGDGIFDSAGVLKSFDSNGENNEKTEQQSSASSDFLSQHPYLRHSVAENTHDLFKYLQSMSQQISELDYLLVVENIDVLNQALEDLQETIHNVAESFTKVPVEQMQVSGEPNHEQKENEGHEEHQMYRPSLDSFTQNHEELLKELQPLMGSKVIDSTYNKSLDQSAKATIKKDHDPDEDKTWTVLVSELKLLWTLEIRDAVVLIVQDILFTIDIMKIQLRATQSPIANNYMQKENTDGDLGSSKSCVKNDSTGGTGGEISEGGKESKTSRPTTESSQKKSKVSMQDVSSIAHLLRSKRDMGQTNDNEKDTGPGVSYGTQRNRDDDSMKTVPTFDVHLANPQVQLHSEATGGSIVLAIHGVYIEGRRFIHLLSDKSNPSPEDLLRKTDFQYTIDSAEIYAIGEKVDVTAGLQWLERMDPAEYTDVEEKECAEESATEENENISFSTSTPLTDMERLFLTDKDDQSSDGKTFRTAPVPNESVVSSSISGVTNVSDKFTHFARQNRQFTRHFEHHRPRKFKAPRLLRKILNPCTFHTHHTFLRQPLDLSNEELSECINGGLFQKTEKNSQGQVVLEDLELHIDTLSFMLDSYQFRSLIDLFRNVLLEPPKPPRDRTHLLGSLQGTDMSKDSAEKIPTSHDHDEKSLSQLTIRTRKMEDELRQWGSTSKQSRKKKGRNALRSAAQGLLVELEKKHLNNREHLMRRIEYTLGKLKWKVQSPDYVDDVEISFTGFSGEHNFTADGSVETQIGLEFFRVGSDKPGPSSINFYDPTAIITAELLGTKRSPCQRCGVEFDMSANEGHSCVFHSGIYRMSSTAKSGTWSCCGACWEGAPGCVSRPHTGKERAAQIRVEALPSGIDGLTIYKHFEINVFPSERAVLVVQATKDLAKLFMSYFVLDGGDIVNDDEDTSSSYHGDIVKNADAHTSIITTKSTSSSDADLKKAAFLGNKVSTVVEAKGISSFVPESITEVTEKSTYDVSDGGGDLGASPKASTKRTEVFFLKYWRVGNINVQVSLAAFRGIPDFSALDIVVPDFAKAYKVGTAGYVLKKFLSHFISEILKSAASSGLGKFKDKMMRSSNEPMKTGENPFKPEASETSEASDLSPISSQQVTTSDKVSILGSVQKIKKKQTFKKLLKKSGK